MESIAGKLLGVRRTLVLRLATVNVGGWSGDKALRLRQITDRYQLDALLVTETRRSLDDVIPGRGRTLVIKGKGTKKTGVAVVKPEGRKWSMQMVSDRLLTIAHPAEVFIIAAYGPTEQAPHHDKEQFWSSLREVVRAIPAEHTVIVMGDLNAGEEDSRHPSAFGEKRNFAYMLDFAMELEFDIQEHGPTWTSPFAASRDKDMPSRTLDRCLVRHPGDYVTQMTTDFTLKPVDHAILVAIVNLQDVDRNKGRPQNQALGGLDDIWRRVKKGLRFKADPTLPLNALEEFWKAKRLYEQEQRDTLRIVTSQGTELTNEEAVTAIKEFLQGLWGTGEGSWEDLLIKSEETTKTCAPGEDEITRAITRLKTGTALGRDRIKAEAIKNNPEAVLIYKGLLDEIWKRGVVPTEWKAMKVKPIPKAESTTTPAKTRPITCLSVSTKILNSIIIERYGQVYEERLSKSQHAYRKTHSVNTALEELMEVIQAKGRRNIALLDMSKAYDRVTKHAIKTALDKWELPAVERNLIVQQYVGCDVYVELNGYGAEGFTIERGIRQGCAISCMVFALIMSLVHAEMDPELSQHSAGMVSYSDDIVLHAGTEIALRVLEKSLNRILQRYGLSANEEKTQYMTFDTRMRTPRGSSTHKTTDNSITWLGFQLTEGLTWEPLVRKRLQSIREASDTMSKILGKKRVDLRGKEAVLAVQGLVGAHCRVPSCIILTQDQKETMENEIARVLAKHANIEIAKATVHARKMMGDQTEAEIVKKPTVKCQHCGKDFRNNAGLTQHHGFCKGNPLPVTLKSECPYCKKSYHNRGIQRHIQFCKVGQNV